MKKPAAKVTGQCPFYNNGYCEGYLSGKLRVCTVFERACYCLCEGYVTCPVYIRGMEERGLAEPARAQGAV